MKNKVTGRIASIVMAGTLALTSVPPTPIFAEELDAADAIVAETETETSEIVLTAETETPATTETAETEVLPEATEVQAVTEVPAETEIPASTETATEVEIPETETAATEQSTESTEAENSETETEQEPATETEEATETETETQVEEVTENTETTETVEETEEVTETTEIEEETEVTEETEETETEEDEHIFVYTSNDDGTHTVTCKNDDCDYSEIEDCQYSKDGKATTGTCIYCGYENTEELALSAQSFSQTVGNTKITVSGMMPADAYITVNEVNATDYENIVNDSFDDEYYEFSAIKAFDIKVFYGEGIEYQPIDTNETLTVTMTNIENTEDADELGVYRVTDDATVTEMSVSDGTDSTVTFDTDHFTVYVVGGVNHDTDDASIVKKGNQQGVAYTLYNDGLLVLSGEHAYDYQLYNGMSVPHTLNGVQVTSIYCDYIPYAGGEDMTNLFSAFNVDNIEFGSNFISNTNRIRSVNGLFSFTDGSTINLSNWDMSGITDMSSMFESSKITSLDVTGWNTSNVTNMSQMFSGCTNLASVDVKKLNVGQVTNMSSMFARSGITAFDASGWDTSNVSDMNKMFFTCRNLASVNNTDWNVGNVTNMYQMFANCSALTAFSSNSWNTGNVTDMRYMFSNCTALKTLDLSNLQLGSLVMKEMFSNCAALESLGVSNWDMQNVTATDAMFLNCTALKNLDTSNWKLSSATDVSSMFSGCGALTTLDVSNWNLGSVTDAHAMFAECRALTALDVSNWQTGNMTYMHNMFFNCKSLATLDVSNWNTGNTVYMIEMFSGCESVGVLDVSNWNTSNLQDVSGMFDKCYKIVVLDMSGWDISKIGSSSRVIQTVGAMAMPYALHVFKTPASTRSTYSVLNAIPYSKKLNDDMTINDTDTSIPTNATATFVTDAHNWSEYVLQADEKYVSTCSICGAKRYKTVHTHDYVVDSKTDATCTDAGLITYKCSKCGDSYTETIDALGHDPDEPVKVITQEPTCTDYGYYDRVTYCKRCGEEIDRDSWNTIPELGHDWDDGVITIQPTCEDTGEKKYTCKRDASHTYTQLLDTVDHVSGPAEIENEVPATCTTDGSYDEVFYCVNCGEELESKEDIPIPALGHIEGEPVIQNRVEPKVGVDGHYDEVVYCDRCSEELRRTTIIIPALGVDPDPTPDPDPVDPTPEPTPDPEPEEPEHQHQAGDAVKEDVSQPTCTETGHYYKVTYCKECGEEMNREFVEIPALGHDWNDGEITTEPTCTKTGVKTFTCRRDASHTYTEIIPALGHIANEYPVIENYVKPEVGKAGSYDEVIYCKRCNEELSRKKILIPALQPTYPSPDTGDVEPDPVEPTPEPTPEEPDNPTPEEPEKPTPDKPEEPDQPTPDKPDKPIYPSPSTGDVDPEPTPDPEPVKPDKPDKPDKPKTPDKPDEPDNPTPEPLPVPIPTPTPTPQPEPTPVPVLIPIPDEPTDTTDDVPEKKPVDIPEIVPETTPEDEPEDIPDDTPEETPDNTPTDTPESTEKPEITVIKEHNISAVKILSIAASVTGSGAVILLLLFWWRRRKVTGKVIGENVEGLRVTLTGKDNLETETDKDGMFIFKNVKEDNLLLNVYDKTETIIFSTEIYTRGKDEEDIFTVVESKAAEYKFTKDGKTLDVEIKM